MSTTPPRTPRLWTAGQRDPASRPLGEGIERAVIVARDDTVTDVARFLTGESERPRIDLALPFREAKARVVEEFERAYIASLLEAHGGKLSAAAKHADMDPKNFWEKVAKYGLRRPLPADDGNGEHPAG
jgi:DNA-binding NtrC family response regulator